MAKIKPRVKVPKKAASGDIVEIKALISHPMHTGLRKDKKTGKKIPRRIINKFTANFNGQEVFVANFAPAVSANPYIAFPFKAKKTGTFDFEWTDDNGDKYNMSRKMTVS